MAKWSMRRKQQYSVFTAVFCRSSVNIEDMDTIKELKKQNQDKIKSVIKPSVTDIALYEIPQKKKIVLKSQLI